MTDKEKAYKITHRGFRVFRLRQCGVALDEAGRLVEIIEKADSDFFQRRYQDSKKEEREPNGN